MEFAEVTFGRCAWHGAGRGKGGCWSPDGPVGGSNSSALRWEDGKKTTLPASRILSTLSLGAHKVL